MKKQKSIVLAVTLAVIALLLVGIFLIPDKQSGESINDAMRDEVLHETNKISLFGLIDVNPGLISAFTVTGILFVFSLVVRVFVIPKFSYVPGRFQLVLETAVGMFDGMAKGSSPKRNKFLGAYIFTAAAYIFIGTTFELLGLQAVTTAGRSVAMPAPLADINGAITIGCLSYLVILGGGVVSNGIKGVGRTLKDFSLPISMSFRLFGACVLLRGAFLCAASHRGRDVHAAARAHSGVRSDHAHFSFLRRSIRKNRRRQENQETKKRGNRKCLKS